MTPLMRRSNRVRQNSISWHQQTVVRDTSLHYKDQSEKRELESVFFVYPSSGSKTTPDCTRNRERKIAANSIFTAFQGNHTGMKFYLVICIECTVPYVLPVVSKNHFKYFCLQTLLVK